MSLFNTLKADFAAHTGFFQETESAVVDIIKQIMSDAQVAETDIKAASAWAAKQAPQVAEGLQTVLSLVETVEAVTPSVGVNADVKAAVVAAQLATSALTAFANTYNAGAGTPAAVVQGYVAVKQAQAAVSSASAAAATATPATGAAA